MAFQMQLTALAKQQFKAPVCIRVPTTDLDKDGKTVYQEAHFIGHFQCLPVDEAREEMRQMAELQKDGDANVLMEFAAKQLERDFIGFEPHPKYPFPFLHGDQPAASTPENIKQLLLSKEAREAIQAAYSAARSGDVGTKNSKK